MAKQVSIAFNPQGIIVPIASILPLKQVKFVMRSSQKYQQVLSSVREVGIIEPLIVFPHNDQSDAYLLLDGHVRLEVLRQIGETHARLIGVNYSFP
ncbi:MAG: ParB/Srx family N-terminal domain-containing protein [Candidatus Korobacteraceae bacterium]|jgi:ParB-like chromosome segregation protein Spo0J